MNWRERVDDIKFSIKTGDGKMYYPLYKGGEKEKEFNTSSFNFINVYGTLVDRKKPQSGVFPLVFWFQGADNIDQADAFEASADDPRAWEVTHPFYGKINGQPMSIKRDDSSLNITEVTVPFWESIEADYPFFNFSVKDNTRDRHKTVYANGASSYVENPPFTAIDISKNTESINGMAADMENIQDGNTYSEFQNTLNSGLKAIDKLLENPLACIESIQNFLDLPATYVQAIEGRLASYENIFNRLKASVLTLADKKYFESIGASAISSVALTVVTPINGDYVLVSDVNKASNRLRQMYSDYQDIIGNAQVSIYNVDDSYTPDPAVQSELSSLVVFTLANLYKIAFNAKRERIVVVGKKTNLILLTHRYLSLDDEDENLGIFVKTNDIKLGELFSIDVGREIRYAK